MADSKKKPKKPGLNTDYLPLEQNKKYVLDLKRKRDFRGFKTNNWCREMIEDDTAPDKIGNATLRRIYKYGAALWLNMSGDIVYRPAPDADPVELGSDDKAKRIFCSMLKEDSIRFFKGYTTKDGIYIKPDINAKELLTVADEFTPFASSEFYIKDGLWKRTSFRPTPYLLLDRPKPCAVPKNTERLLRNLCNDTVDYYDWTLNWLAGFLQTLQKSHVSLVLRGDQGSGKSMFFEHVITPLFGEKHCVVVDQARIESQFKNWIQNILFYNLNEVAVDMKGRKYLKNFLKQLITDTSVQAELKHKDAEIIQIYGNIYITSNEALPVEIEPSDRRFTVFQTGPSFRELGINGGEMVAALDAELMDFAKCLKTLTVDWDLYNKALDTPEKQAIQSGTNSKLSLYIKAILKKDYSYFDALDDVRVNNLQTGEELKKRMISGIEEGKVIQEDVIQAYKIINDVDHTNRKIMENMRMLEPVIFSKDRTKASNSVRYIILPWGM